MRFILLCVVLARLASVAAAETSTRAEAQVDLVSGLLDLTWPAASVHRASFSIEINGTRIGGAGEVGRSDAGITQQWKSAVARIDRQIDLQTAAPAVIVRTRVTNISHADVTLGSAALIDAEKWTIGQGNTRSPGAVFAVGDSQLNCEPFGAADASGDRAYAGSTVLALAAVGGKGALVAGFITAPAARPAVAATFRPRQAGTRLSLSNNLAGRKLKAGESIDLDTVYLAGDSDAYAALASYADAVGRACDVPPRHGATSLWCSWYAHRMAMSEQLVLENAAIAARHLRPLGLAIMQLDHGWQRGDVTGDWEPNERFPHGLKWLAGELQSRYGLKLGLWIAPTDVAETSLLYKQHPDWVLKGGDGKPLMNWKWYWKPNPNCYELDATNPAAAAWLRDTFARLRGEGASYFKIDFIASSGGEQFIQSDPYVTRGWSNLRSAMQAIRAGAGRDAWIRYCQPPPLLSVGLANSAYGGDDTLDAGLPDTFHVLRDNARSLAAGWWINDRLYHREVCDMSVRMQADVEETRVRLAMMTLAGCSISFSDELQHLPMSRIRMMQQCLPPGAPEMRPLDLFERAVPSVWHLHCKTAADEWDVVGLFNFDDAPQERAIDFTSLGLPADADAAVYEFWQQEFAGVHRGRFAVTLAPHISRVYSIRRLADRPQVIGSDMHMLQGFCELTQAQWDQKNRTLSGRCHRAAGLDGRLIVYVPAGYEPKFDFPLNASSAHLTHIAGNVWAHEMHFDGEDCDWTIPFVPQR